MSSGDEDSVVVDPAQTTEAEREAMMAGDAADSTESVESAESIESSAEVSTSQGSSSEWESVREAASGLGYKFDPGIQDDRAAIADLVRSALANRQADYYAQLGRQLAPHADKVSEYIRQQQAPPKPSSPKPWEKPEFDERWVGLVERDPSTGLYVGKPGVPAEVVEKVNRFAEWRANYERDPIGVAREAWREDARQEAMRIYQEQFAQMKRNADIERIVSENSSWLYQTTDSGSRVTDPVTGQPVYTPIGAEYIQGLQEVRSAGVMDPVLQDRLAQELVRGRVAQRELERGKKAGSAQSKAAIVPSNKNPLGALSKRERMVTPGATEPSKAGLSLTEQMRMDLSDIEDGEIFGSAE